MFAQATSDTLPLHREVGIATAVLLMIPAVYTFYSTLRYFGIRRAMGGDHFRKKYQKMPLVRKGAFKYSRNAMYLFGFFILYAIAMLFASLPALLVALFQHTYIWVHYHCTEKPDMALIFGEDTPNEK